MTKNPYESPDFVTEEDDSRGVPTFVPQGLSSPEPTRVSAVKAIMVVNRYYFSRFWGRITLGLFTCFLLLGTGGMMAVASSEPEYFIGGRGRLAWLLLLTFAECCFFAGFLRYYASMLRGVYPGLLPDFWIGWRVPLRLLKYAILGGAGMWGLAELTGADVKQAVGMLFYAHLPWGMLFSEGRFLLAALALAGLMAPGGWIIVAYGKGAVDVWPKLLAVWQKNWGTLLVVYVRVLTLGLAGLVATEFVYRYFAGRVVPQILVSLGLWFFLAPYLLLHYPVCCMMMCGERLTKDATLE